MSFSLSAKRVIRPRNVAALSIAGSTLLVLTGSNTKEKGEHNSDRISTSDEGNDRVELSTPIFSGLQRALNTTACTVLSARCEANRPVADLSLSSSSSLEANTSSSKKNAHFALRRRSTLAQLNQSSTKASLDSKYEINPDPVGKGAFGEVFVGRDRQTGESVAIKKIWKQYSNNQDFLREMNALLQIRAHGGHPHICQLRENFEEKNHFALVLDLVKGGEMFDRLVDEGAYSESDARPLIREVASALAFLHAIGMVHCDLKPENLMLSSKTGSASVKLVDFGCSEQRPGFKSPTDNPIPSPYLRSSGGTVAYSPPECFEATNIVDAPVDMWSLGVILHVMLTGVHPFDTKGDLSDAELERRICALKNPSFDTADTAHLSPSAKDLLKKLLEPNPMKRLTAKEMLEHPWVKEKQTRPEVIGLWLRKINYEKVWLLPK